MRTCVTDLTSDKIQTPSLILDQARFEANRDSFASKLAGTGVTIRPHLKTVKSVEVASRILAVTGAGAAVSTLQEAETLGPELTSDLLYAVSISPQKLDRVLKLMEQGVDLKILLDSPEMARQVSIFTRRNHCRVPVLIELDVDGHRSGIPPDQDNRLLQVAAELAHGGVELKGVMTHAGGSYSCRDEIALRQAAEREQSGAVAAARLLESAGHPCSIVSIGSTPTALSAASLEGITEVRAGVCFFFDLFQAGLGVCQLENIALSVLATVIGHQYDKGWIIVDAGWMALSLDRGTLSQSLDQHFGLVCNLEGQPLGDLVVLSVNQEHGIIGVRPHSGTKAPNLAIGDRIRILPNHACATAAQHDAYYVVDHRQQVVDCWPRYRGW